MSEFIDNSGGSTYTKDTRLPDALQERSGMMEDLARYVIILAVFLGLSWTMRLIVLLDASRRVQRKNTEKKTGVMPGRATTEG